MDAALNDLLTGRAEKRRGNRVALAFRPAPTSSGIPGTSASASAAAPGLAEHLKVQELQAAFPAVPEGELRRSVAAAGGDVAAARADVAQLLEAQAASVLDGVAEMTPADKAALMAMAPADRQVALAAMGFADLALPGPGGGPADAPADPARLATYTATEWGPAVKRSLGKGKPPRRGGSAARADRQPQRAAQRDDYDDGGAAFEAAAGRVEAAAGAGGGREGLLEESGRQHAWADGSAKAASACFTAARGAYARGDGAGAAALSRQGYEYLQRSKVHRRDAGIRAYVARNSTNAGRDEVDLHGLAVPEALEATMYALANTTAPTVRIITGRGTHSAGNVPRLNPAIKAFLRSRNVRFADQGSAALLVYP